MLPPRGTGTHGVPYYIRMAVPSLVEELTPTPDPWAVARRFAHLPHLMFLDSADRQTERGRYSYISADPPVLHRYRVDRHPDVGLFRTLAKSLSKFAADTLPGLPPFQGGFAGFYGYGLGRGLERTPEPRFDEFRPPDAAVGQYDWVISFDHLQDRAWVVSTGRTTNTGADPARVAAKRLAWVKSVLTGPPGVWALDPGGSPAEFAPQHPLAGHPGVTSNFSRDEYLAAVRRAVEYVHAGDCFQVNVSQRLLAKLTDHPLDLYARLRDRSPAPYSCYFDAGDFQVVSASPEQFLKVSDDGGVVTRPIKGTRPRGATPAADAELVLDLTTNPKDRAENVMIVDLLRNDLGRVCEFRSVTVPKLCEVETFSHVHHLVSEVRGRLRPGLTAFDLFKAAFPGGSVTGAPKVRAMEVIAELEPTARGPYCGSVGFVGFDGAADSNILIRTFTAGRGWVQFPVGGGVVADSDPAREYEETLHKAAGLLKALIP
jgi:para-aminobenzoate synthetase component I